MIEGTATASRHAYSAPPKAQEFEDLRASGYCIAAERVAHAEALRGIDAALQRTQRTGPCVNDPPCFAGIYQ